MSEVDIADSTPAPDEELTSSVENVEEEALAQEEAPTLTENAQKRFDKITGDRNEAQERAEALATQNAEMAARLDRLENQTNNLNYQDPGAPRPENFEDDLDYAAAKGEYQATKKIAGMLQQGEQQRQADQRKQTMDAKITGYNQKLEGVRAALPDFHQVTSVGMLQQVDGLGNITPEAQAIMEVDNGPQAFYHIQKDPNLAMQLNSASPTQAAIMIARISDQFAKPSQKLVLPDPIESEGNGGGLAPKNSGRKWSDGATFS